MTHRIVNQLRIERAERGLSQMALAQDMGSFQNHVSRVERGGHSPTLDFLDQWACALGYELTLVKKQ